jgi:putative ABC transport system permease protein
VSFVELVCRNVLARKVRTLLTAAAVSIGITTIVVLGVLTHSLKQTAISVLRTGEADFTVAQEGVSDVLKSSMDDTQIERIRSYPETASAVGVLVAAIELDQEHPFFLELGMPPEELAPFGVQIVEGRAYTATAADEVILGYRAARDFDKSVGDIIDIDGRDFRVVGIFSTGQVFGDSASMLPLVTLQERERKPATVTLAFVQVKEGADMDALRERIEYDMPELATVRTESEFGRIDRNLSLISAANVGVSVLALIIGAVSVMNTMLMSVFERTREFGVLRAIGWSRLRVLALVLSEALLIGLTGAAIGVGAGMIVIQLIGDLPELVGVFQPDYTSDIFARALAIAVGMAFIGAIYPSVRAALLVPLDALRHE